MNNQKSLSTFVFVLALTQPSGCAVFTVADAVVSTAATAVKVTAKTVGAAADLVIPDSGKKDEKKAAEKK
jgi:hypothetical protein